MLELIISLSLYAIAIISALMAFTGVVIHKKESPLTKIMVSFIVITTSTIIGTTVLDIEYQRLFLQHFLLFGLVNLLFLQADIKASALVIIEALMMLLLLFMPLGTMVAPEESKLNINLIIMIASLLTMVALYFKVKKSKLDFSLNTTFALIALMSIIGFIIPAQISLPIITGLMTLLAWFNINLILKENEIRHTDLEVKLSRLELEFNDEVRRAVNKHTFHLKEVQEKMSHINKIDNLTKAYNKKAVFNIIEDLIMDKKIDEFTLIMFDIDHFKALNDTLGHVQGDMCLKTLAKIALDSIRTSDYLGRYGGDEFLIVLPKSKLSTAITIAERFRKNIDEQTQPHFTVSVGLSTYPEDGHSLKSLLDIADKGLYLSKEKGRNSVSYHNPTLDKKY